MVWHTWFLKPDDIGHIRHIYAALELKSWLTLPGMRFIFAATDQSRLLFIRVYILAAKEDSLEKIYVIL